MSKTMAQVSVFLLVVLGVFLWIGYSITAMTGSRQKAGAIVDISPEGGEIIYWGKGRCFTCHSMGGQGSAVRGPNHGQFGEKFPLAMGARAEERAKKRNEATGKTWTAVDYLVESLASPGAFIVEGYKNEMAVVYAPPISLNLTEIKAVIAYLMAQGGDHDLEQIDTKPSKITASFYSKIAAATEAGGGDPEAGATVFEDNCVDCHSLDGKTGNRGPDLSTVAKNGLKTISTSILQPTKKITKGYETWVVVDKNGRQTIGLKTREEGGEIAITKANGEAITISKADIKEIKIDPTISTMPDDLSESMTVKDFQDVLSFMMLQKDKKTESEH